MKLHTKSQAPREGQAVEEKTTGEPYVTTREDYLAFLVDSKQVYEALDDVVNNNDELAQFRNTGLERTKALEQDIEFMCQEYQLDCPPAGQSGRDYAAVLRELGEKKLIPEFMVSATQLQQH
jgi:heme oxygenase (biliverdin-producing, ferredoxin)